jgi:hypothetical protein
MPTPVPPPVSDADASRLATAYMAAEYRWARDGDWHDIRIGLQAPGLELLHPDVRSFGLLSAWNPWSQHRDESSNRREDEALAALLAERGFRHIPAFSSATNRSWREPGWVIFDIAAEALDDLARRFGQLGALWWARGQPVRLRMQARKPVGSGHGAMVDWLE